MRTIGRLFLFSVIAAGVWQGSAFAGPAGSAPLPVGVVLQADHAQVDGDAAAGGATIFDGETLKTDTAGSLRVRFGNSQAYLLPKTLATVHQADKGFSANLTDGTVVLSAALGESFNLLADGASIRPGSAQITVAQITVVSPTELVLLSRKGNLEVTVSDETKSVPEGASYRMLIQPGSAPSQGPQGSGAPAATGSNHFIFILLAAAAAGTGIGIWRAVESPSKP